MWFLGYLFGDEAVSNFGGKGFQNCFFIQQFETLNTFFLENKDEGQCLRSYVSSQSFLHSKNSQTTEKSGMPQISRSSKGQEGGEEERKDQEVLPCFRIIETDSSGTLKLEVAPDTSPISFFLTIGLLAKTPEILTPKLCFWYGIPKWFSIENDFSSPLQLLKFLVSLRTTCLSHKLGIKLGKWFHSEEWMTDEFLKRMM